MNFLPRHDTSNMDDMDHNSSSSSSGHSMMSMVFQTETATPLFSSAWTPTSGGAYAGTCIFLVVLTIIGRCLLAFKAIQELRWLDRDAKRRYVVVNGGGSSVPIAERISTDSKAKLMTLTANGVEENVMVVERRGHEGRPWRFSVDPMRAVLDTVIAGIGYLLMLAIMTMNVGYFMSVLAGVFIGSLAVGRYTTNVDH